MSEARRLFMTADLDPHDTTLHVHAEALREIEKENDNGSNPEEEDINFRQINEKIYYLLIKNVSRDSPLTPEEVQYLRSFRSSMSGEQWQRWLSYARSERKRLKESGEIDRFMRKHQGYPDDDHSERSSRVVPTTMSLAEAIDASNNSRDDNHSQQDDHSYSSHPAPQSTSNDASRRRSLFHMTSVPVNVAETTIGEPVELSPRRRNFTPTLGQPPKEHSQPEPMPLYPSSTASRMGRKPVPERNATSPGRVNVNVTIPRPQHENVILSTPAPKPMLNEQSSSTAKGTTPNRYSVLETTPAMLSARSSSQTMTTATIDDGFSTVKPVGLRAHSAPRLRPTMPSNLAVTNTPAVNPPGFPTATGDNGHQQSGRKATTSPSRFTSHIIEEASFPKHLPFTTTATTTGWANTNANASSHHPHHPHHVASQSQTASAPSVPFLSSPGKAVAAYVTKQQQQQQQQQLLQQQRERNAGGGGEGEDDMYAILHRSGRHPLPPSATGNGREVSSYYESKRSTTTTTAASLPAKRPEPHHTAAAAAASISSQMLDDLRETLESAQMGTSRIENACTAARFLISSLGALSQQVDPNTNQNLENSRQVLEEMLRSLEKSKGNFGRIEDTVHKNLKVEDLHPPALPSASSRPLSRAAYDRDGSSRAVPPPPPPRERGHSLADEEYEDEEVRDDRDRRSHYQPPTQRHHQQHQHQHQHQHPSSSSYDDEADQRSVPTTTATQDDHLPSDDYLRFQPLADDIHTMHHTHRASSASTAAPLNATAFQTYRSSQHPQGGGSTHQFQSSLLRRTAATAATATAAASHREIDDMDRQQVDDEEDARDMESLGGRSSSNPAQLMWSPAKSFRGGQRVLVEDHSAVAMMTEGRNQAQNTWGLVTRVCINRGPLVKAYEEFPIRLDAEAMSVDIVWRESRVDLIRGTSLSGVGVGGGGGSGGSSSRPRSSSVGRHMRPTASSAAGAAINYYHPIGGSGSDLYDMESQRILRRERFQFDAMYIGPTADRKLQDYVRYRTRAALQQGTNLVFLCNACGESAMGELEAPVTVALGSGGGSGIATNILLEAFKVVAAHNATSADSRNGGGTDSYILRSAVQTQYASTKMAQDNRSSSISLTAVLLNGSTMVDMLSNAAQQGRHSHQPRIQRRGGAQGEVTLQGVTTLDLSNVMDFERIIGLLLGRRTGINETMQSLQMSSSEYPDHNHTPLSSYATWTTQSVNPATEKLRRLDLVNDFTSSSSGTSSASRAAAPNVEAPSSSSTMVLSFRITLGSSLMPKRVLHIRVVCPCGKDWTLPNFDLSVLSESIGALPHTPPEGLLAVSPLSLLLTDASQQPSNFVSVVHVNRVDAKRQHLRIPQSDQEIAVAALNSMRVSCLAR